MTSVNFNASATSALRTLQQSNAQLDSTQSRISTGLKIGQAKDNAAYWSISTSMKSDNKALGTVKDALGLGAGTVDTAYQGLDAARAQLDDMKAKLTSALNPSVDRAAVQNDIDAYLSSLKSIASSSVFSGENWLSVNSGVDGYSSQKQVVASYARAADGSVSIETIDIDTSKIALFDANANGTGIISSQSKLIAGGVELQFGGNATTTPAPSKQGLDTVVAKVGTSAGTPAAGASAALGTFSPVGIDVNGRISFQLAVNGGAATTVNVSLSGVGNATQFGAAIDSAITAAGITGMATTDVTSGVITLKTTATGSASSIVVSGLSALDGNGQTISAPTYFGLTNTANAALGSGTTGTYAAGTFANGGNVAVGDKLKFTFEFNGDLYDATYEYTSTTGASTDANFATALQGAVNTAVKRVGGSALGAGNITVTAGAASALQFETVGKGPNQKVTVVAASAVTTAGTTAANITKGLVTNGTVTLGTGGAAVYSLGTYADQAAGYGDTISFDVSMGYTKPDGTAGMTRETVSFSTASGASGANAFAANMQAALDAKFGAGKLKGWNDGGVIKIQTIETTPNASVVVNGISMRDGDGTVGSTLGMSSAARAVGNDLSVLSAGTATAGSVFVTQTFGTDDEVSFDVSLNAQTAKSVKIDKASVEAALANTAGYTNGSGTITTSDQYLKVVKAALVTAGVTGVTASLVASGLDAGKLQLTTDAQGANNSVTIANVATKGASDADTISVDEISITSDSFKALTTDEQTKVINAYINVVSDKLKAVTAAASNMGSVASRIESQKTFVSTLMDTIDKGVSGLVDADMNEESTKLQALQVKQQLGVQALSIANQSAQNVLSLFRG